MKSSISLILAFLFLGSISCQVPSLTQKDKLKKELEEVFQESKSVGAAVLLTNSDSVVFQQYFGYADLASKRKVDAQSLFGVGSITKTFTTLAVLKLIEEGKFELEDKLSDILPEIELKNKWSSSHPLRLYHLLEHTSGFDDLHPKDWTYPLHDDNFDLDQAIDLTANSMIPRWKPGSRFAYSNVNFVLAGYIVDKFSPRGYDAFMREKVFDPMEMDASSLLKEELNPEHLAKSYGPNNKVKEFKHIIARPAGSVFSSAEEMGKFMRMMLKQKEDFLSSKSFSEMETHHSIADFSDTHNGFRLGLRPSFQNGRLWLGHGGAYNNYKAAFYYHKELDLGIFMVTNGPNSVKCLSGLETKIFDHVAKRSDSAENELAETVDNPHHFTGYYNFGSPRVQLLYPFGEYFTMGLTIKENDGQLFISGSGQPERALHPKGDGRFSFSSRGEGFDLIFPQDESGVLYSSLGFYYEKTSYSALMLLAGSLIFALLLALSSQLVVLARIIYRVKTDAKIFRSEYLLGASSSLLFAGILCFLFGTTQANLHEPQFMSVILFLSSIFFPILAIAGLFFWIKDGKDMKRLNWSYQ
ncbi:MAG: serine hydrolase domain-containing protein, partial [Bacteroidota bacterium]